MTSQTPNPAFTTALLAGGVAGTTVDLSLFPLDTLKTRLQSSAGFFPSGGFRGIYRGVGSALVGSAPGAAFFFVTYEGVKDYLLDLRRGAPLLASLPTTAGTSLDDAIGTAAGARKGRRRRDDEARAADHMLAATLGETAACAVRVPTEVVKQRAQAGLHGGRSAAALRAILDLRAQVGLAGVWRELYRGWGITVMREVPFTVIQFPVWEGLKAWGRRRKGLRTGDGDVGAGESALYGSASGALAAALTTPLDVLKTRVMLSREREKVFTVLKDLYRSHGVRPFFAGIGPRVMWISAGGAIFLGSYQWAVNALQGNMR
ncbi:mitochondrial carrier domain-containing protein [Xylariaceae sp. FL0016]|nr:mitochondrial carrier domain-containing protein [Xylariaceae sp. FL0016]